MFKQNKLHPDFIATQKLAYDPLGLQYSDLVQEIESQEYGACAFKLNDSLIRFRVAKITPTKIGQFVTFWKRIDNGPIMPFDMSDSFDFLVVSVRTNNHFGQFIFPKNILWQNGLISKEGKGGKRAMRVYPPWDKADNPQAKKTQAWQINYFCEIEPTLDVTNKLTF